MFYFHCEFFIIIIIIIVIFYYFHIFFRYKPWNMTLHIYTEQNIETPKSLYIRAQRMKILVKTFDLYFVLCCENQIM